MGRLNSPLPDSVLDRYFAEHPEKEDFRKHEPVDEEAGQELRDAQEGTDVPLGYRSHEEWNEQHPDEGKEHPEYQPVQGRQASFDEYLAGRAGSTE